MSLQENLSAYTDSFGLVQNRLPSPGDGWTSGNGLLFTGEAVCALAQAKELSDSLRPQYAKAVRNCAVVPGLYRRHPALVDQEGPDDYIGLGAVASLCDVTIAEEILKYGQANLWCMNNVTIGKKTLQSWLGRFPALICHLKFAAGQNPPLWQKIYWTAIVAFQPWNGLDEPILSWLLCEVAKGKSRICDLASKYFYRRLYKKYANGIHDVLVAYFGAEHPLAKAEVR
jgi:hypothetical protein